MLNGLIIIPFIIIIIVYKFISDELWQIRPQTPMMNYNFVYNHNHIRGFQTKFLVGYNKVMV